MHMARSVNLYICISICLYKEGTATHASIFAQRIQWTEESGELWYSVAESDTTEGT